MRIRNETPSDAAAIEAVTVRAFKDTEHTDNTEQFIVRELRKHGALAVSLVAEDCNAVIGHVAISPITISDSTRGWYGLGPISIVPEHQGNGIGTELMNHALRKLRDSGAAGCVVLGDPAYYSRFGFAPKPSLVLPNVPQEYFQAILFKGPLPSGTVSYHEAFSAKA